MCQDGTRHGLLRCDDDHIFSVRQILTIVEGAVRTRNLEAFTNGKHEPVSSTGGVLTATVEPDEDRFLLCQTRQFCPDVQFQAIFTGRVAVLRCEILPHFQAGWLSEVGEFADGRLVRGTVAVQSLKSVCDLSNTITHGDYGSQSSCLHFMGDAARLPIRKRCILFLEARYTAWEQRISALRRRLLRT